MGQPAQADVLVPRANLKIPEERAGVRMALFRALSQLGYVERVDGYVVDPPDGPFADSSLDKHDRDAFAIVRIRGQVLKRS